MILIDEISTTKPSLLSVIDSRLRQVTGIKDIKFGSICVLVFGEFSQLLPLKLNHWWMMLLCLYSETLV